MVPGFEFLFLCGGHLQILWSHLFQLAEANSHIPGSYPPEQAVRISNLKYYISLSVGFLSSTSLLYSPSTTNDWGVRIYISCLLHSLLGSFWNTCPTLVLKVSQRSTGKNSPHPESSPQGRSFQLQLLERGSPRNLRCSFNLAIKKLWEERRRQGGVALACLPCICFINNKGILWAKDHPKPD